MTDTRTPAQDDRARRLQLKRRVKRGVVASYIHQLSQRHSENAARKDTAVDPVLQPAAEQAA